MGTFLISFVFASVLNFIPPTESNGNSLGRNWTEVNLTIFESELDSFKFDWNSTNYTFYDDSLVLALNLNNNTAIGENNTQVVDISGNGNNGTIYNSPNIAWTSSGKFGGAMKFNGINGYIEIDRSNSLEPKNSITIEAWIYQPVSPNDAEFPAIVYKNSQGSNKDYVLFLQNDNYLFAVGNGTSRKLLTTSEIIGQWVYLVGTYNGTMVNLYKNTILSDSKPFSGEINYTSNNIKIGHYGNYFNGSIDEVKIWSRALSEEEIRFHYLSSFQKYNSTRWGFYNNITNLGEGSYDYQGWMNDTAGNSNSTEIRTINIDPVTPPITNAIAIKDDGNSYIFDNWASLNYINITLLCNDELSDCNKTYYCTDENNLCIPDLEYGGIIQLSTEGTSYIRFRSNDVIGNLETIKSETIRIDTSGPVLNFVFPTRSNILINRNWARINLTIFESSLNLFKFNWNYQNYSIYDVSLILGFNFNNNLNIGETLSYFVDISKYKNIVGEDIKWNNDGKIGGALQFNGKNNYVDCGNDNSLSFEEESFSTFAWIKFNSLKTNQYVINGKSTVNDSRWNIYVNSVNLLSFYIKSDDGNFTTGAIMGGDYSPDVWYHIGFVKNLTSRKIDVYVNGAINNSVDDDTNNITSQGVFFGAYGGSNHWFNGSIDEVMIFNRSLNSTEINWMYQRSLQSLPSNISTTGLIGQWHFDEISGNVAEDSSGNENNGILQGFNSPQITKGKFGSGLSFNGEDDYLKINKNYTSEDYTLMGWIKPRLGQKMCVWDLNSSLSLCIEENNDIITSSFTEEITTINLSSSESEMENNSWIHMGITYNKNLSKLAYYENGELKKNESTRNYFFSQVNMTEYNNTAFEGHLQGLDTDKINRIFLSFSREVKVVDINGTEICSTGEVLPHHGDCAYNNDKIYIPFSGDAVWVYNSTNCSFIESYALSEFPGELFPGGMAYYNGHFFIAEGISYGKVYPLVHEYDENFTYLNSHLINYNLSQGIQNIGRFNGSWWIGAYDAENPLIRLNDFLKLKKFIKLMHNLVLKGGMIL